MAKVTKREMFNKVLEVVKGDEEMKAFIEHEIELLTKKNASGGEKKPTKNQEANEAIKANLVDLLTSIGSPVTISDLQKADATAGELTNQKISSLLRQLVADGKVVRAEDKRKAVFSVA